MTTRPVKTTKQPDRSRTQNNQTGQELKFSIVKTFIHVLRVKPFNTKFKTGPQKNFDLTEISSKPSLT